MLLTITEKIIALFLPVLAQDSEDEFGTSNILVIVILICALITVGLLLALATLDFPVFDKIIACSIALTTSLGYFWSLYFFKSGASLKDGVNFFATVVFFSIVAGGFVTGGFSYSPNLEFLVVLPMLGFLMLGRQSGIQWSVVAISTIAFFYVIEIAGIQLLQFIPAQHMAVIKLLIWLGNIFLLAICIHAFHFNYTSLSARLLAERSRFAHEAEHDPLTNLANRTRFYACANKAIEYAVDEDIKAGVIYIDLDHFKPINDNYGHHEGDEVLIMVAKRIKAVVRSSDTVGRLGGDEFGVILHGIKDRATVARISENILRALCEPMQINNYKLEVGCSIGVAVYPDDDTQLDGLLLSADAAMYQAKTVRNQIQFASQLSC